MRNVIILTIVAVFCLFGCRTSILHKEGAKEVVNSAVDKLNIKVDEVSDKTLKYLESLKLDQLTGKIGQSVESSDATIKKIGELSESLNRNSIAVQEILEEAKRLSKSIDERKINQLLETLNASMTEINSLIKNVNLTVERLPAVVDESKKTVSLVNENLAAIKEFLVEIKGPQNIGTPWWAYLIGAIVLVIAALTALNLIMKSSDKNNG